MDKICRKSLNIAEAPTLKTLGLSEAQKRTLIRNSLGASSSPEIQRQTIDEAQNTLEPCRKNKDAAQKPQPSINVEHLLTLQEAAKQLGIRQFKITRAAKAGLFPTYTLFNRRKLVRLSEVIAAIEASKQGGFNGQL